MTAATGFNPATADDVIGALRDCSSSFDQLKALFAAIALPGADAGKLAAIGESVCFEYSNYADDIRENAEKGGIKSA